VTLPIVNITYYQWEINEYGVLVELYWQGKAKVLRGELQVVQLRPWRNSEPGLCGERLTTIWAMATSAVQPSFQKFYHTVIFITVNVKQLKITKLTWLLHTPEKWMTCSRNNRNVCHKPRLHQRWAKLQTNLLCVLFFPFTASSLWHIVLSFLLVQREQFRTCLYRVFMLHWQQVLV